MNPQLPPRPIHIPEVTSERPGAPGAEVATRDHALILEWARRRGAVPATGEASASGPASVHVTDDGAGIRFNFPASSRFRPIAWDEWFANFDHHELLFVYENDDDDGSVRTGYRIVKAADWAGVID